MALNHKVVVVAGFCSQTDCALSPMQSYVVYYRETTITIQGVQSYCIVQLNHPLNRGKLTSITNNINSFSAPRGILLLGAQGWMLAFQQSLNKHPLLDLSMPGSIPHVPLWFGKSLQPWTLLYVTSSVTKLRWNWPAAVVALEASGPWECKSNPQTKSIHIWKY